jgi:outer membrane protein OmpA-like peptidoglycan-associated protein
MSRISWAAALVLLLTLPVAAQKATPPDRVSQLELDNLNQAQAALKAAEQAGAPAYATTLYDEAAYRLRAAQENWNAAKAEKRDEARLQAVEAMWAARAALAKARWIGTNTAIRSLQSDITRLGGRSDLKLNDESPSLAFNRGANSRQRIAFAQSVIDAAKAAGAEQFAADDLRTATQDLESARKITKAIANSENADYLAYISEMMARRALYTARANESNRHLQPMQLERTRLAQAESERQAAAERAQRAAAEAQARQLQAQLSQEQANRQAQQAEVDRLRQQVEESRRAAEARLEQDRAARAAAEQNLDAVMSRYESAIASGSASDVETLRRQVEDQQIALRAIQERERLNEQNMGSELDRLRSSLQTAQQQGNISTQLLADQQADLLRRQQELEQLRKDREADIAARTQLEQQHATAIAELTKKRQEAEAQAQQLQQQVQQAQAQAQQAQAQAVQASQAAQQAQQQQQVTAAELEKTRQALATSDAEARQLRMENELARVAATKRDKRGIIVTLPGIFFDTGKSVLKPGAKNTLKKIADQLKGDPSLRVSVEGHTDNTGSEDKNLALSEKRAQAVRDYLVNAGVPADHITASGKGDGAPVATNKTAAGRQQNRRVELVITTG